MTSVINMNGLKIKAEDGRIVIDFDDYKKQKDIVIDNSGTIQGDVTGNIEIKGKDVTLVIEGDVTGNITGKCNLEVDGDITGNIVGCNIK